MKMSLSSTLRSSFLSASIINSPILSPDLTSGIPLRPSIVRRASVNKLSTWLLHLFVSRTSYDRVSLIAHFSRGLKTVKWRFPTLSDGPDSMKNYFHMRRSRDGSMAWRKDQVERLHWITLEDSCYSWSKMELRRILTSWSMNVLTAPIINMFHNELCKIWVSKILSRWVTTVSAVSLKEDQAKKYKWE